jgi:hypothetical protein
VRDDEGAVSELKSYLEQLRTAWETMWSEPRRASYKHKSVESLVLSEGKPYGDVAATPEEREEIIGVLKGIRRWDKDFGRAKMCYRSAWVLMDADERFEYVEGFASRILPVSHAWCVFEGRVLVDPTYLTTESLSLAPRRTMENSTVGIPRKGSEYFGILFERAWLLDHNHLAGGSFMYAEPQNFLNGLPWRKG